ncbi:hypothetical protein [Desulfonatronum thiosulfatophilum]|uniref:hypothetical protein n=1 Tax=Desulfonatronum thiosulfatophilum TaxID=617002 RepID=UPI00111407C2|nr:hypothetical protein [Desulfonatronum thiosulfatophilum]
MPEKHENGIQLRIMDVDRDLHSRLDFQLRKLSLSESAPLDQNGDFHPGKLLTRNFNHRYKK